MSRGVRELTRLLEQDEPCGTCGGKGGVPHYTTGDLMALRRGEQVVPGDYICGACNGSGKARAKGPGLPHGGHR